MIVTVATAIHRGLGLSGCASCTAVRRRLIAIDPLTTVCTARLNGGGIIRMTRALSRTMAILMPRLVAARGVSMRSLVMFLGARLCLVRFARSCAMARAAILPFGIMANVTARLDVTILAILHGGARLSTHTKGAAFRRDRLLRQPFDVAQKRALGRIAQRDRLT